MKIHMVRKGDTLWNLAEKFNVQPEVLLDLNPQISHTDQLVPGFRVKIPHPPSPLEIPPAEYLDQYVVKQGDTLWKLSKAWNVPLKALISVNPQLRNPNVLLDGETVYIPKLAAEIFREEPQVTHIAQVPYLAEDLQTSQIAHIAEFPQMTQDAHIAEFPQMTQDAHIAEFPQMTQVPHFAEVPQMAQGPQFTYDTPIVEDAYVDRDPDLSASYEAEEFPHISAINGTPDEQLLQWGDPSYLAYSTSATKPYEMYGADPKANVPAYPNYESVPDEQSKRYQGRVGNGVKAVDKVPGKVPSKASNHTRDKTKGGKSKTKDAVAAITVQSQHPSSKKASKPIKKSSHPWTNI